VSDDGGVKSKKKSSKRNSDTHLFQAENAIVFLENIQVRSF
jgi:hypothetical protein